MKKKFIVMTLCFTIIFTSINYKKVDAFDLVISPTILATVVSLGVGAGIVLKNNDDIYDMGRLFVDYVKTNNDITMDVVKTAFASVGVMANGLVSVNSSFLDIVKGFFDSVFVDSNVVDNSVTYYGGLPYFGVHSNEQAHKNKYLNGSTIYPKPSSFYVGDIYLKYFNTLGDGRYMYEVGSTYVYLHPNELYKAGISLVGGVRYARYAHIVNGQVSSINSIVALGTALGVSIPYVPGSYNWDKVKDKVENDKIGVAIPGNVGDLVGQPGGSTVDGSYDYPLVGGGSVTYPGVDNPSVEVEGDKTFPNIDSNTACPECGLVGEHAPTCSQIGTVDPPITDIFPPWGGGIDFSPVTQGSFIEKFPFSLASDVKGILDMFNVKAKAPVFEVPLVSEKVVIDLTQFSVWSSIIRLFILLGFVVCLINLTRKVIG